MVHLWLQDDAFVLVSVDFDGERFLEPNVLGELHFLERSLFKQPIPIDEALIVVRIDCEISDHERGDVLEEM